MEEVDQGGVGGLERLDGRGLIVGYNEPSGSSSQRTGSHNVVVGPWHTYTSYGGLVVGESNTIFGPYASVSGGRGNTASGEGSTVSGGDSNTASGLYASVSGGELNIANANAASVSGGFSNGALGNGSSVSGGSSRVAPDLYDWRAGDLFQDQ